METISMQPVQSRKWYQIWWDVWRHPSADSCKSLLIEPDHDPVRGFVWIGVISLIVGFLVSLAYYFVLGSQVTGAYDPFIWVGCETVLTPIAAVIGVLISTAIMHGAAKVLGGTGKWGDLAFCFCAIAAPNTLIVGVFGLLFAPLYQKGGIFFIPWLITFAIGFYAIILQVTAISAVENIGSGKAFLAIILPGIVLGLLGVCCTLTLLIPAISRIGQ